MMRLFSKLAPSFYVEGCAETFRATNEAFGFRMLPSMFIDAYMMGGEL